MCFLQRMSYRTALVCLSIALIGAAILITGRPLHAQLRPPKIIDCHCDETMDGILYPTSLTFRADDDYTLVVVLLDDVSAGSAINMQMGEELTVDSMVAEGLHEWKIVAGDMVNSAESACEVVCGNPPPVALIEAPLEVVLFDPASPVEVIFDASSSSDPQGKPLSFEWSDGGPVAPGAGIEVVRPRDPLTPVRFSEPGFFKILVTVTDVTDVRRTVMRGAAIRVVMPTDPPLAPSFIALHPSQLVAVAGRPFTLGVEFARRLSMPTFEIVDGPEGMEVVGPERSALEPRSQGRRPFLRGDGTRYESGGQRRVRVFHRGERTRAARGRLRPRFR